MTLALLARVPLDPHPELVSVGTSVLVVALLLVALAAFGEIVWSLLRREPPRR